MKKIFLIIMTMCLIPGCVVEPYAYSSAEIEKKVEELYVEQLEELGRKDVTLESVAVVRDPNNKYLFTGLLRYSDNSTCELTVKVDREDGKLLALPSCF